MSHGAAEIKWVDLGILNPIYERELNKPNVDQTESHIPVLRTDRGEALVSSRKTWPT